MRPSAADGEDAGDRRASRLLGHRRPGDPQHADVADHRVVDVGRLQLHVRRLGDSVEEQLGILGRGQGGERQRGAQLLVASDELRVDPERLQLGDDVVAERIGPHPGQHRAVTAETCRGDGDIGRRPADRLDEALVVEPPGAAAVSA